MHPLRQQARAGALKVAAYALGASTLALTLLGALAVDTIVSPREGDERGVTMSARPAAPNPAPGAPAAVGVASERVTERDAQPAAAPLTVDVPRPARARSAQRAQRPSAQSAPSAPPRTSSRLAGGVVSEPPF